MTPDALAVTIGGFGAILFVGWFFLWKKEKAVRVSGAVEILAQGGYTPEVIEIPKGQTTKITFFRKDPSECLAEVVLPDFKIRRALPLGEKVTIELTPQKIGEYAYTCGMHMYRGMIRVV